MTKRDACAGSCFRSPGQQCWPSNQIFSVGDANRRLMQDTVLWKGFGWKSTLCSIILTLSIKCLLQLRQLQCPHAFGLVMASFSSCL